MIEYHDIIRPRITDINYGGHLGHIELLSLLHEIRIRFLNQYSMNEVDIFGHALILKNLNLSYENQAFWGNELKITMQTKVIGAKIIFSYIVFNATLSNNTAIAEINMFLFDLKKNKPVKPNLFIEILKNDKKGRKH